MSDPIHYLGLSLANVRAFSGRQTLDLSKDGKPARWCVIIGENGVGKTTLLQALAAMRPVPTVSTPASAFLNEDPVLKKDPAEQQPEQASAPGKEAGPPDAIAPALADYENARIESLVRRGDAMTAGLYVDMVSEQGEAFSFGYDVVTRCGELESAEPKLARRLLSGDGPLVIAYSAFRHAGHGNLSAFEELDPTEALFDEEIKLVDPDEVPDRIDYNALLAKRADNAEEQGRWEGFRDSMLAAIAALIPKLSPEDLKLEGSGISVRTPSGFAPLAQLSLGAQTTVAWLVDLAWRLRTKFPDSLDPFRESAIVLVDEVELHLHPVWQRSLRHQLLKHFPRIQFIVSTHSPVIAQESIAAGDPVSIVRWEGDHAVIKPDPFPAAAVRLDEVMTGAFELETSLPLRFEALLAERRDLIQKGDLSPPESDRLTELSRFAHAVQSGSVSMEADIEQLMSGAAEDSQG
ncbi:MAG: AAA family ATPase [Allosphingosinicella sp.]